MDKEGAKGSRLVMFGEYLDCGAKNISARRHLEYLRSGT